MDIFVQGAAEATSSGRRSLEGSWHKLRRGGENVRLLNDEVARFINEQRNRISVDVDMSAGTAKLVVPPLDKPPPSLSLGIGECLHNFRCALDYSIYELAWRDSQAEKHGTQFPICDSKSEFDRRSDRWLDGVKAEHRTLIAGFQPYSALNVGKNPKFASLAILRDLSNADKHRLLTTAVGYAALSTGPMGVTTVAPFDALTGGAVTIGFDPAEYAAYVREVEATGAPAPNPEVDMKRDLALEIAFSDAARPPPPFSPVVPVLARMGENVEGILARLAPLFGEEPWLGSPPTSPF